MTHGVVKNTSFLTIASIGQKILAFVYFTIIARWIGPENVGKFIFAVSLTSIISIFIDLGLTPTLIRETAKEKTKGFEFLNVILSAKIFLSILAYAAAIATILLFNKDSETTLMVFLAGGVMIFDSLTLSFWGVFRGQQNLAYESKSIVFSQAIILSVGLIGLKAGMPTPILVIALLCGSIFSFIYSYFLSRKILDYRFKFSVDKAVVKLLAKMALPFALAGIFTRAYSYIDQVLLSVLVGNRELGWYSVPYKITFALQFVPSAFAAAIYPAMSNYCYNAREKLAPLFENSMKFLMIIAMPIIAGTLVTAQSLILGLYGPSYTESILSLQIMITSLLAVFLSFPVGSMLNGCDKQHVNTVNLGITMVLDITLNLILIPKYQHVGAAIAATISLYYLFLSNLYFVKKITAYNSKKLIVLFLKLLLTCFIMAISVDYVLIWTNLPLAILAGVVIYGLFIFGLGIISKQDLITLKDLMRKNSSYEKTPNNA
jgi:O-antigen/teichoic acid export membrane protein